MISHVLETKATRWDSWTEGGGWARALLVGELLLEQFHSTASRNRRLK